MSNRVLSYEATADDIRFQDLNGSSVPIHVRLNEITKSMGDEAEHLVWEHTRSKVDLTPSFSDGALAS